jgi:hypothetical protein
MQRELIMKNVYPGEKVEDDEKVEKDVIYCYKGDHKRIEIPLGVKYVRIESDCCVYVSSSVEEMELGDKYNSNVLFDEGSKLKCLKFGENYNREVRLPSRIENLQFGGCYNQITELPSSLKLLVLGRDYDNKLDLSGMSELYRVVFKKGRSEVVRMLEIPKGSNISWVVYDYITWKNTQCRTGEVSKFGYNHEDELRRRWRMISYV